MDDLHRRVARRIDALVSDRGLSLKLAADFAGVSRAQLYRVVAGTSSPTLAWLQKVAAFFGVEVHDLIAPDVAPKS